MTAREDLDSAGYAEPMALAVSSADEESSPTQAWCDAIQAEVRASLSQSRVVDDTPWPPPPPALEPTDDQLRLRLAEELDHARQMIEQMGDSLSADPALVMRHMVELQSVDIVAQMLGHIANVIRCSDPDGAVERIGMCELKARLTRGEP